MRRRWSACARSAEKITSWIADSTAPKRQITIRRQADRMARRSLGLLPDTAESVWGAISVLVLIVVVLLLAWLVRAAWRQRRTIESLEDRVARLEVERVESDSV
jgi:hypothetical protein